MSNEDYRKNMEIASRKAQERREARNDEKKGKIIPIANERGEIVTPEEPAFGAPESNGYKDAFNTGIDITKKLGQQGAEVIKQKVKDVTTDDIKGMAQEGLEKGLGMLKEGFHRVGEDENYQAFHNQAQQKAEEVLGKAKITAAEKSEQLRAKIREEIKRMFIETVKGTARKTVDFTVSGSKQLFEGLYTKTNDFVKDGEFDTEGLNNVFKNTKTSVEEFIKNCNDGEMYNSMDKAPKVILEGVEGAANFTADSVEKLYSEMAKIKVLHDVKDQVTGLAEHFADKIDDAGEIPNTLSDMSKSISSAMKDSSKKIDAVIGKYTKDLKILEDSDSKIHQYILTFLPVLGQAYTVKKIADLHTLEDEIKTVREVNEELGRQLTLVTEQDEIGQQRAEQYHKLSQELTAKVIEAQELTGAIEGKLRLKEHAYQNISKQRNRLVEENNSLELKVESLVPELSTVQIKLQNLQEENGSIVENFEGVQQDYAVLENEYQSTQEELVEIKDTNAKLVDTKYSLTENVESLNARVAELETTNSKLDIQVKRLEGDVKTSKMNHEITKDRYVTELANTKELKRREAILLNNEVHFMNFKEKAMTIKDMTFGKHYLQKAGINTK
jgi:hypothetical protein